MAQRISAQSVASSTLAGAAANPARLTSPINSEIEASPAPDRSTPPTLVPLPRDTASTADSVLLNDWHVVAKSADIPAGTVQPFRLLDTDLVIWRGQNHQVQVWRDRCPHRSVRLSQGQVVENALQCSYHGMQYDSGGQCIAVPAHPGHRSPAHACAQAYQVQEQYGLIFVCLGTPAQPVPPFPEWGMEGYRFYITGPYSVKTNGYRAIENFLDVAHFPFIHGGILGDLSKPEIDDYDVTLTNDGVYAKDIRVWQPDPYGTGEGAYVHYDYWAFRPLTAYLKKYNPNGECLTLLYSVSPVSETESIAWMSGAINYGHEISHEEICAYQNQIVLQDVGNLESHSPQVLPIYTNVEFHVPSDRTSIFYRRWLKQLGVRYGTM
jgi:phenylpropionate dioxygenase-like ring-hydroxylating dioxygenase large terminal subunit